ncbi:MAG: DNA repair protein RecN [Clostridia bacterium]|nr:DNA repair protein RecN [Clostridia bacterium]
MLHSLHIENIAVIKQVDLEFSNGFMVISGETGAGKSIIIDSINLILGAKSDKDLIRHGESTAMVSALFTDLSELTVLQCAEHGIVLDDEGSLLIQRSISQDGRSGVKINGRAVNLAVLKQIAPGLVSIHGQTDTGVLSDVEKHIDLLDIYASSSSLLSGYRTIYYDLEKIRRNIDDLIAKEAERERMKEILSYQIKDIDSAKLHEGEEEELVDKKVKIKNSEKIIKNSEFAYKALKGSEKGSAAYLIDRCITALNQLSGVIPEYEEYAEKLRDALSDVEDVAEEVFAVVEDFDTDPTSTLNDIESRLDKISKLKRKYGYTVKDILEFADKAKAELEMLENYEDTLTSLREQEEKLYKKALSVADALHENRAKAAEELKDKVCDILEFLDMPGVVFFVNISGFEDNGKKVLNKDGYDNVEFYLSANKGAEAQSLAKIASGGEIARVMLAIKSIVVDKDGVSSVIFDEIDTGVSGKTARKIGLKMRSMSSGLQIFCVTHSAQIASLADIHFLISKSEVCGKTETSVKSLDYDGRVKELSRILGGINITDSQRAAAIDMLNEQETN